MRGNQAAKARKLEAEARKRDETADPAHMTDNALWAAVYRLQGRRNPRLAPRIRELTAEQRRRHEEAAS